jgi:hypothetical protein
MTKLQIWAAVGTAVGFISFNGMFHLAAPRNGSESLLWIVFSVMGALPVAIFAVLFGAIGIIRQDLREIRREIMRLEETQERICIEVSALQFKAKMPNRTTDSY